MSGPVISVLCPAYRTEPYLGATLDSVLAQTSPDWELVVVDNGMSDAVAAIVEPYLPDPRVRFLRQPNRGLDGGFTAAAAVATGDAVLPLATDDLLVPTTVERMSAVLAECPRIDVLACDAHLLDDASGALLARSWSRSSGLRWCTDLRRPLALDHVLAGRDVYYAAAFRRHVWDAAGGYRAGNLSDLALWLEILGRGFEVRVLPERLGVFRLRADSTSRAAHGREAFLAHLERICAAAAGDSPRLRRAACARVGRARYFDDLAAARAALVAGDTDAARRHARRALSRRTTPRAAAVVLGTAVAPGLLRRLHPVRQRIRVRLSAAALPRRTGHPVRTR